MEQLVVCSSAQLLGHSRPSLHYAGGTISHAGLDLIYSKVLYSMGVAASEETGGEIRFEEGAFHLVVMEGKVDDAAFPTLVSIINAGGHCCGCP